MAAGHGAGDCWCVWHVSHKQKRRPLRCSPLTLTSKEHCLPHCAHGFVHLSLRAFTGPSKPPHCGEEPEGLQFSAPA